MPGGIHDATVSQTPLSRSDTIVGTLGYMSPEQLRGRVVDGRTDVWAFGCVLYECLCGQMAFPGATMAECVAATLEREPDLDALGAIPAQVTELIQHSLRKDPATRLASMAVAMEWLDAACAR
jgi:serine/threonine protein kinase